MTKLVRREVLLAKIESTYNTDSVPTPASDAILVENLSHSLEGLRLAERAPVRASIAKLRSIYGGTLFSMSFDVEIKGSGAAGTAPEFGVILRACGFSETLVASTSVTYEPASTGHESVSMYLYEDGSIYKITGCRGNISGNFETGSVGKFSVSMTGHLASKTDVAFPAPTYLSNVPEALINVPFTVGGYAAVINAMTFDMSNEIATPPSIAATDGYSEVIIGARDCNGSFDAEATLIATADFLADLQAGTTAALSLGSIGATAGNIFNLDMPVIGYREMSAGDRDGLRTSEMAFGAAESTTDDEISMVFT